MREPSSSDDATAGECGRCAHSLVQTSSRGGRFWRCERADGDARFARYPKLPMRGCAGYEAAVHPHATLREPDAS